MLSGTMDEKIAAEGGKQGSLWARSSLVQRYAMASLPVFLLFSLGLGWWVSRAIERQVIHNVSVNVALYVQSFIAPSLQELADNDSLSPAAIKQIEMLLSDTPLGKRVRSVKVWQTDGRIVYYSRHQLIGRRFEPTDHLLQALNGRVSAQFEELTDEEDAVEARLGLPLLEIYSPVRDAGSGRIIAVAEFYQDAAFLHEQLSASRWRTIMIVVGAALVTYLLLFGIVRAGGRVIQRQREAMHNQLTDQFRILRQNRSLHERASDATRRVTELNERFLRRVSAELHDGPAQSLSLALLRLDSVTESVGQCPDDGDRSRVKTIDEVRNSLLEALGEVRQISRGLALPELAELNIRETLNRVTRSHSSRTGTEVESDYGNLSVDLGVTMSVRLTAYRLVQEALMNIYKHAPGSRQQVQAWNDEKWLWLKVSDDGPGFDAHLVNTNSDRLGLSGLQERVESIGGHCRIFSESGQGTIIEARLPLGIAT